QRRRHHRPSLFPYTTLFRSVSYTDLFGGPVGEPANLLRRLLQRFAGGVIQLSTQGSRIEFLQKMDPKGRQQRAGTQLGQIRFGRDRKSTRLNSSHLGISYAV